MRCLNPSHGARHARLLTVLPIPEEVRLANQRVLRRSTTLPELVLGQGRPPTGLRPAWLDGGVARLWSSGAAVPRVESASTAPERRPDGGERWARCPERR